MAKNDNSPNTPFLGGGPRFNQAGENTPMPGEKIAAEAPRLPFGGPRVWVGVLVVLVMIAALFAVYGNGLLGVSHKGGNVSQSVDSRPDVNADAPSGQ